MELLRFLLSVFSIQGFMPHEECLNYRQDPGLLLLTAGSDSLIGIAYVAISVTLVYLVWKGRSDIPLQVIFLAFGVFIIACGGTHFLDVATLWWPAYWLSALVKAITAVASVATAIMLPRLIPVALRMVRAARISEQRKIELENAHADLEKTHHQLESLYETSRDMDRLKTQFFANVSHELRTPLALVLGPTEKLLEDPGLTTDQRHNIQVVHRNASLLLKHVNDLLDLAKLEAGSMRPGYRQIDLAELVRVTTSCFESLVSDRQISFLVDTPETAPAQADPDKLQRILINLLSNAFKFTPIGGSIRCSLEVLQDHALLSVADSGPGIPPDLQERIFERFWQGEEENTRLAQGTGLGLAIARDFVNLHQGAIRVSEAPDGGALFTIDLPLQPPAGVANDSPGPQNQTYDLAQHANELYSRQIAPLQLTGELISGETADEKGRARREFPADTLHSEVSLEPSYITGEPGEQEGAGRSTMKDNRPLVLVVEDNQEMNRFVVQSLEPEYRTAAAFDGIEGIEKTLALRPDAIVSDIMMPRMTGSEMVHRLRREHIQVDGVPILLLSARADDRLRVSLLKEGAQDFLMKPFSPAELRARVGVLTRIKRARDLLQEEANSHLEDLEALAQEVFRHKRELQSALDAMRVARDQAERASQVKSNFLSLVSHELRTPLTIITTYMQLLERSPSTPLPPQQQQILAKMRSASRRLSGLIDSLLEYTRIQAGRLIIHPESIELASMAADVLEESSPPSRGLELRLVSAQDLPPLESDPRLVRLILVNLVGNAIKYSRNGPVEVRLEYEGPNHRIAVQDSGPGIPVEHQDAIFEPFHRLDALQNISAPGVGLGLTIVREIVDALGGEIHLHSRVGEGSTFTVLLPSVAPASGDPPIH